MAISIALSKPISAIRLSNRHLPEGAPRREQEVQMARLPMEATGSSRFPIDEAASASYSELAGDELRD